MCKKQEISKQNSMGAETFESELTCFHPAVSAYNSTEFCQTCYVLNINFQFSFHPYFNCRSLRSSNFNFGFLATW